MFFSDHICAWEEGYFVLKCHYRFSKNDFSRKSDQSGEQDEKNFQNQIYHLKLGAFGS